MMATVKSVQQAAGVKEIYFLEPIGDVVSVSHLPKLSSGKHVSPLNLDTKVLVKMLSHTLSRKFYFYKEYEGQKFKVKPKPLSGNN
jgi:hypothetical protein